MKNNKTTELSQLHKRKRPLKEVVNMVYDTAEFNGLGATARAVYLDLILNSWGQPHAEPTMGAIGKRVARSRAEVARSMKELKAIGFITSEPDGRRNRYFVRIPISTTGGEMDGANGSSVNPIIHSNGSTVSPIDDETCLSVNPITGNGSSVNPIKTTCVTVNPIEEPAAQSALDLGLEQEQGRVARSSSSKGYHDIKDQYDNYVPQDTKSGVMPPEVMNGARQMDAGDRMNLLYHRLIIASTRTGIVKLFGVDADKVCRYFPEMMDYEGSINRSYHPNKKRTHDVEDMLRNWLKRDRLTPTQIIEAINAHLPKIRDTAETPTRNPAFVTDYWKGKRRHAQASGGMAAPPKKQEEYIESVKKHGLGTSFKLGDVK